MPVVAIDDELTLSYWERGTGNAAVVLLPGPTDSWRSYQPILHLIAADLRVVAVSLRGHGDSSKPPAGYRIEDLASDVGVLLNALHIDRAVLAGHSGSCLVARRVTLDDPTRVTGLFLEASPTTLRGDEKMAQLVETVVTDLSDPIDPGFARAFIEDTSTDDLPPDLVEQLVEDVLKVPVVAWREMFGSLSGYDDTAELAALAAPVLLVWGDEDRLVPRAMQDRLLRLLPRSELRVYGGVGHTPRWEQPERVATDLSNFAARALGTA